MKPKEKILWTLFILLSLTLITPMASARGSILDQYRSIPPNLLNDHKYRLQFKNHRWISRSIADDEIKPIVDIKNGYLKITDKRTGGGAIEQELAFFRTKTGSGIIGVNLIALDGVGSVGKLKFYKHSDNQWIDITKEVLPQVDLSLFVDENFHLHTKEMGKVTESLPFLYQLPRIGTTINVKLELGRLMAMYSGNDKRPSSAVKETPKNLKYQEVKLIWDKKNTKFTIGGKTLFAPSGAVSIDRNPSPARKENPAGNTAPETKPLGGSYTPPPGDAERQAILDALRKEIKSRSGTEVKFEVLYLKVNSGWAWLRVLPHSSDGDSHYEDVSGLFQKTKGRWKLVETRATECAGDPDCVNDTRYFKKLKTRFPAVPQNIFPY